MKKLKSDITEYIDENIGLRSVSIMVDSCINDNVSDIAVRNRIHFLGTMGNENFCGQMVHAMYSKVVYCFI